jgi:heme/copper-type cytochrome/quinol oxidase subunit 2
MFSKGQLIFAIGFVIAFTVFVVWSYQKDQKKNPTYFKGSFWVLIGFIVFVSLLLLLKRGVAL